jgi:hypothetical protein
MGVYKMLSGAGGAERPFFSTTWKSGVRTGPTANIAGRKSIIESLQRALTNPEFVAPFYNWGIVRISRETYLPVDLEIPGGYRLRYERRPVKDCARDVAQTASLELQPQEQDLLEVFIGNRFPAVFLGTQEMLPEKYDKKNWREETDYAYSTLYDKAGECVLEDTRKMMTEWEIPRQFDGYFK